MKSRASHILTKSQLLVLTSCLLVAAVSSPEARRPCSAPAALSKFDYVVFASIADSRNLLAMSGYDAIAGGPDTVRSGFNTLAGDSAPSHGALDNGDNTRSSQCHL
jgi:hypothetical protein